MPDLLSWLTDSIGGGGGGMANLDPMGNATGGMSEPPPTPPSGIGSDAARAPDQPSPPISGPVPLPNMRPPGAGPGAAAMPATQPPLPPMGGGGVPMPDVNTPGAPVVDPSFLRQPTPPTPGGIGSDAARAPNQPGNMPPVPMPMARPPGAPGPEPVRPPGAGGMIGRPMPGGPADPAALPPNATSTMGTGTPGAPATPQQQEVNWLGKLMGVSNPEEAKRAGREISRGMAAAFKNAPSGVGKGKFAAFAGGVGAGMTGAQAETDREEESQRKSIAQMILTKNAEGQQGLNLARTQLALEQAKQVMTGNGSAINSPQQLYLRAQALANNDQDVKAAKAAMEAKIKAGYADDSKEVKELKTNFEKLLEQRRAHHMGAVGLDPKIGDQVAKLPGMSEAAPLKGAGLNQQAYDNLPVGGYYVHPKTGKLMRKSGVGGGAAPPTAAAAAGGPATPPTAAPPTAAAPTGAGLPPTPPAPVTAPAGSRAAAEDDNTDEDVG
jgi:hypothetical protein